MRQALEVLETLARYENPETRIQVRKPKDGGPIVTMYPHKVASDAAATLRAAIEQAEQPKYDPIELHVLHSHIAGVLFDFMGWLTSRKKRLTLSSTDEAGPAVEAITEFAKMRDLRLEDAQVEHWQAILTTPPVAPRQWVELTDEEVNDCIKLPNRNLFARDGTTSQRIARAIEAKLKEKNI